MTEPEHIGDIIERVFTKKKGICWDCVDKWDVRVQTEELRIGDVVVIYCPYCEQIKGEQT
jgi:hypothetical protein